MPLEWNGDALIARVERAARDAVNETVDATAETAETIRTWKTDPKPRTKHGRHFQSDLAAQIRTEHASAADPNPTGRVGFTKRAGFVGLFHEEATKHEHEHPALRPAADIEFPQLQERIARRLK